MPKSKLRGGAKAHKSIVELRNQNLNAMRKKAQAQYAEMFQKQMEALKVQQQNENGETTELNSEVIGEINVTDAEVVTPEINVEN